MLADENSLKAQQDRRIKDDLDILDELFDADKLTDSDDTNENVSGDSASNETLSFMDDFKLLVSNKDKLFDVEHFEFLINMYARSVSLKMVTLDKIIGAFRTMSLASKEIALPDELVSIESHLM